MGDYDYDVTDGIRTSSLDATTLDGTDTYTVTQTVTGTFTRDNTGNYFDGSHDNFEDAEDDYEVVQTGAGTKNYTLTITGTNAYTDEEDGDGFTGDYTRTKTGADDYTMVETGTKIGGSYSQTITGEEEYTLEDVGDNGTGHYTRTITGGGSYNRTTTGAGATLPTDTSTIGYGWDQTGDPGSGVFDLTPTGSTRYDLLEDFFDISNTQSSQAMGHMNIYAFGQTFVDPTASIGYSVDVTFFGWHRSASIDFNLGWSPNQGFSGGPSISGGFGLGAGGGVCWGPQWTFTNADSVADLAGQSHQIGFFAAKGDTSGGAAAVIGNNYSGVVLAPPLPVRGIGGGVGWSVYGDVVGTALWQWF